MNFKKALSFLIALCIFALSPSASISAEGLAEYQDFHDILGINDKASIKRGVIVSSDGKCADIEYDDLQNWLDNFWNFAYDLVIAPENPEINYDYYIKFYCGDTSFAVYSNSGVIAGSFGEPYESHGRVCKCQAWYLPYIGNARNALYTANTVLFQKYLENNADVRSALDADAAPLPSVNLLPLNGSSDWAKDEIQIAASCNLLLASLTDKYKDNITRLDFCALIYRLIATEFSPYTDSRVGIETAIYNIIEERQLQDSIDAISFSDCDDYRVRFLSAADIIYGMGDGSFAPDADLTREQAAVILHRTAKFLRNKTIPLPPAISFSDKNEISDWALDSVGVISAMGIMKGISESEFSPKGAYTVEQAIATMLRLYEHI